jgi:hypothetical protein
MSPCCGRPNNRASAKDEGDYYSRFAYLSAAQKEKQRTIGVSNCTGCDALTMGDPCTVCGIVKYPEDSEEVTPS